MAPLHARPQSRAGIRHDVHRGHEGLAGKRRSPLEAQQHEAHADQRQRHGTPVHARTGRLQRLQRHEPAGRTRVMPVMERKARRSPAAVRKPIPIFGLGKLQRSPFVSTVERINAVVELTENGRQQAAIFNLPGLIAVFNTLNNIPFRAFYIREGEDIAYGVQGEQFISMTLPCGITLIATLNTDEGPAWISDNGDELFVNDGSSPGVFHTATNTDNPITDPAYPSA